MRPAPFDIIEPRTGETPLLVEVPHASLRFDPESMALNIAPASALARDADLYMDELIEDAPVEGATLVIARLSRYVIDLNRRPDDYDEGAVRGGPEKNRPCGLLWRATSDGTPALVEAVPPEELERRLSLVYRPYHEALASVTRRKLARFGVVVVLSAHSMPSMGWSTTNKHAPRADVVAGTRGRTTAASALIDMVGRHAHTFGWSVSHDDPYQGGATTERLGHPEKGMHAIQIELARRLYMDEVTLSKSSGFGVARSFCRGLVAKLGTAALG